MASKIDKYRAGAVRCEGRAKKTRNQADREWQICLARAYLMLAEAEAERAGTLGYRGKAAAWAAAFQQVSPFTPGRLAPSDRSVRSGGADRYRADREMMAP